MPKKNKNYFFYTITIILSILFAINISICFYAKSSTQYKFDLKKGDTIDAIAINKNVIDLSNFENDYLKKKKDSNSLVVNADNILVITTSVIDDISFKSNNDKSGYYSNHIRTIDIIKNSINLYTLLYLFLGLIVFNLILKGIINFINKINKENIAVKDIILFFICNFIIYLSIMYVLLLLSKTIVIISLILYLIYLIYKIKDTIKNHIEYAYIILVTIIGLSFLLFIPPLNVPDEPEHFIKSYNLLDKETFDDNGNASLTSNVYYFVNYYKFSSMNYDLEFNSKNYLDLLFTINKNNNPTFRYGSTKGLSIVPYIPSAMLISIGKLLNSPPLILLLLGRGINLLISIILCYYAVKITPYFKKIFFIIALLPTFIHQSIAINMDWLTNSISLLFIAKVLQLRYDEDIISRKELVKLFVLGLILSFCKFGFFPITFLVLLIPNKKMEKISRPLILKISLILLVMLISFFYNANGIGAAGSSVGPYYTLKYAITHPINTCYVYINTLFNRLDTDIFKGQFDSFGLYTKYNKSLFTTLLIIMYSIVLISKDDNNKKLKLSERLMYLLISSIMILIPYTAMFLSWTVLGANMIDGLQPRYFLVAELLLFIGLTNNFININVKNKNNFYVGCVIFNFCISLFTIIIGFY